MRILFYILSFVYLLFPQVSFAALGDFGDPANSCKAIIDDNPGASTGLYYLQTAAMGAPEQMYCEMTRDGGGWMLVFQRAGGTVNADSCGVNLNDFLHNTCGNVSSLAYGDSYSSDVDETFSKYGFGEYLLIQENSAGTVDSDDTFIIHTSTDIFPDTFGTLIELPVESVCDINNSNCDTTDVLWYYAGTSWFNSSICSASNYNGSTSYKGNYGVCHNGHGNYYADSLFGNRSAYNETKLWGHNNGAKYYMEKVYVRYANTPPKDLELSNNTIPNFSASGTVIGDFSANDLEGDTLTYSFTAGAGDSDNSSFSLSGTTLTITEIPNANVKEHYYIRIQVSDGINSPVEKEFIISVTGSVLLGSLLNPAVSCKIIKDNRPLATTGLYYLKTASMGSARQMHCNMDIDGGGWMLLFQRAGGTNNIESCGSNLNTFLQNSCGVITDLAYGDSYSSDVDETFTHFGVQEYLSLQYNSSMANDNDDSYILHSSDNIFPNSVGSLQEFNLGKVCNTSNASCDTTDGIWKYTGTSWFASSLCNPNNYDGGTSYKGNYGYCHNGYGGYQSNSLFGNRTGYNETKLWAYNNGARVYMERVFVRENIVDTIDPNISSYSPTANKLIPTKDITIEVFHNDVHSGINPASSTLELYKWNGSIWGVDISTTHILTSSGSAASSEYSLSLPSFGKYKYIFYIDDGAGNTTSQEVIFYIDEPEFIISSDVIDIGNIDYSTLNYSTPITVTVKTVGAGFNVLLKRNTDLLYSSSIIEPWNFGLLHGYGYQKSPYSSGIQDLNYLGTNILTQTGAINTNGEKNTFSIDLKMGAQTSDILFNAGKYIGDIDFQILLDY